MATKHIINGQEVWVERGYVPPPAGTPGTFPVALAFPAGQGSAREPGPEARRAAFRADEVRAGRVPQPGACRLTLEVLVSTDPDLWIWVG